jgi:wyosine [tRNA(Phe)-imidazoG37] synthetase (radical SAM superfamily)
MSTFLFDSIIFGPVWSRRLGESLGINLLPVNRKICNFNCIYCECGLTPKNAPSSGFPSRAEVKDLLAKQLSAMKQKGDYLNSITFAGNGEPTLHPEFSGIMDDTIITRDALYPEARITVLTNATLADVDSVFHALRKADQAVLKLDSAIESTLKRINCPTADFSLTRLTSALRKFEGNVLIQTLFFRGNHLGVPVDNTTTEELDALVALLQEIQPECVMIYSIARDTPVAGLERLTAAELEIIAARFGEAGLAVQVTP